MIERFLYTLWYFRRLRPGDPGYQEGLETFSPPEKRRLNFRAISNEALLLSGGEFQEERIVGKQGIGSKDKYFDNDRVYIGPEDPGVDFDPVSPRANYRVTSVGRGHRIVEIIMERMV